LIDSAETLLPHWSKLDLHPLLKRAIFKLGFFKPSPIQSASLPAGLTGRDIVGVAETGSGKTLSYGLPILSHCLSLPPPPAPLSNTTQANQPKHKRELQALILAPTRELALQVSQHLQKAVEATTASLEAEDLSTGGKKEEAGGAGKNAPPRVSVGAIVGGMSAQKQKRVLERGVDILVATPGRLWDLIGEVGLSLPSLALTRAFRRQLKLILLPSSFLHLPLPGL
jgi:ATP-dependent RNA helicase DDX24/MAK5